MIHETIQDTFQEVQKLTVPITIAIAFYVFGFFITAEALGLTGREIVIGLIAGSVGGITTLVAVLHKAAAGPAPSAV